MSTLITEAIIKPSRGTAAAWTSENPVLEEGEIGLETDTGNIKRGDGSTVWTSLLYFDSEYIGTEKKFYTYKDRTAWGMLPFAFANKVSTTTYAALYAEVGSTFEAQHVAAGDAGSGAGYFYPTPTPGGYERIGVPDSATINATTGVDDAAETIALTAANLNSLKFTRAVTGTGADGVPVQVKLITGALPGGLAILTTYYCKFKSATTIELYTTEVAAISAATTNRVDLTDAVGTFRLTQEGIVLDDKLQGHKFNLIDASAGTLTLEGHYADDGARYGISSGGVIYIITSDPITDGTNGTPRTTNESRGKTTITFSYIKARKI